MCRPIRPSRTVTVSMVAQVPPGATVSSATVADRPVMRADTARWTQPSSFSVLGSTTD